MTMHLDALRASVDRLWALVEPLDAAQLRAQAYPSEWTIADVLSHIGSGAVIMKRRVDDGLAGRATPDDFAPSVWDEWNTKTDRAKVDDAEVADRALMARFDAATNDERKHARFSMGPLELTFDDLVSFRLNEHALHVWDVAVALEPATVVSPDSVSLVVDNVELIARYTAKPTGSVRRVAVRTTEPARRFTVDLGAESVGFAATAPDAAEGRDSVDLELPAEALIRLIYGRLDPAHTPPFEGDAALLDELRRAYPGP
jgi:uncharacterized protein (TIGR03083 family)